MPGFFTEHQSQNTSAKYDLEFLTERTFRLIVLPARYESCDYPILRDGNILIKKISHIGLGSTYEYINHYGTKHPIMKLSQSNFVMDGRAYNLRVLFGNLTECPVVGHGEQLPQDAVGKRNSPWSIKLLCTAIKFDFPEACEPVIDDPNPLMFHIEI